LRSDRKCSIYKYDKNFIMEPHEALLEWAEPLGVTLNGIIPKRLPGRGVGVVATRDIKVTIAYPRPCILSPASLN
jgi:hypothetical protein